MGHAKITTTLAIYTHVFEDDYAAMAASVRWDDRNPMRATLLRYGDRWAHANNCGAGLLARSHQPPKVRLA